MDEVIKCGECGRPLPEHWPRGLCSHCALAGALELAAAKPGATAILENEGSSAGNDADRPLAGAFTPARFGEYELLGEVGRGGMGVIYRARQTTLNRTVALKMILAGQFASKQEVLRFRSEAEAAANLQHPFIVGIHETGEHDGQHYFSMDYVEGRTLADLVRDGPLSAERASKYALQIAEAIDYAHARGVLHRDLKPSNVIIDSHDNPRITDFGLAKHVRGDFELTLTGQVLGSPNFMPPEQTSASNGKVGPASDVYGIGAILYCLLSGRPPFHAETIEDLLLLLRDAEPVSPRLLNASVPHDLETVCLKCLEKDPARRYQSARLLAEELGRFRRGESIEARPLSGVQKLWRWCRRRPAVSALSVSVFLLLLAVAVSSSISAWRVNRARTSEQRANRELRDTVSLLELERAEDLLTAHDAASGVAHLAAIVRRDRSNAIAANRLVSALVHRRWARPVGPPLAHSARVTMASFHPDGRWVLTASRDRTGRVWDTSTGHVIHILRHDGQVSAARYSSSGDRIITACHDGAARIWDASSGVLISSLAHAGEVHWAEFSEDGRLAVTAGADKIVRLWDAATGELKREFLGHSTPVLMARFSPDGKHLASGTDWGGIRLWNVDSGELIARPRGPFEKPVEALAFAPSGHQLAAAGYDGTLRIFDTARGELEAEPFRFGLPIWHVAFSSDGKWILTTGEDGAARLWDARTLRPVGAVMRHESGVTFGAFSRDNHRVVTASTDNTARVWEVPGGVPVCQPMRHVERVMHAAFDPDGRRLVTASHDGAAQVWELGEGLDKPIEVYHNRDAVPLAFALDGSRLLTAASDRTVRLWDASTGKPVTEAIRHDSALVAGDCSRDGTRFATGCDDGTVLMWECPGNSLSGKALPPHVVAAPIRHGKAIRSIRFDRTGTRIVTASADGTARVWDASNGQPVTPALTHAAVVVLAQFSADGRQVVTASEDHTARVWDAHTGAALAPPLRHVDHLKWAEFSPDGQRVVTASTDNFAAIWDAGSGRLIMPPLPHSRTVERAVFDPEGRRVATGCLDRTARVWDAYTGQALTPPLRHDALVDHIYFTSDGRRLVTACMSGQSRVWDAETGRPLTEWLSGPTYWGSNFSQSSDRLAIGFRDGRVRIWKLSTAPAPVPEWFPRFAEAVGGLRLTDRGHLELVPRNEAELVQEALATDRGSFYGNLALRFLNGKTPSD